MGKKILLADDSITIQKVIELTFSDEDFDVVTVGNGRLAVDRVQEIVPDIVLCDIIMPEKDGYEVCEFIKQTPNLAHIPVLLLTGAFEPFDQERAARVGSDGYLAKPFEPQTLIAKVKELLAKPGASAPAPPPPAPAPAVAPSLPGAPVPPRMAPPPPPPPPPMARAVPPPPPPPPPPPAPRAPMVNDEVMFIPDDPFPAPPVSAPAAVGPAVQAMETADDDVFTVVDEDASAGTGDEAGPSAYGGETPADLLESAGLAAEQSLSQDWGDSTAEVSWEARANAAAEHGERAVFEEVFEAENPQESAAPEGQMPAYLEPQYAEFEAEPEVLGPADDAQDSGPQPIEDVSAEQDLEPQFEPVYEPDVAEVESLGGSPQEILSAREPIGGGVEIPTLVPQMLPRRMPDAAEPEFEMEGLGDIGHQAEVIEEPPPPAMSFADIVSREPEEPPAEVVVEPSEAAELGVPKEMVAQIAQRVVGQMSEKVIREVAWEIIPDLAEALIKKEIERIKADLNEP